MCASGYPVGNAENHIGFEKLSLVLAYSRYVLLASRCCGIAGIAYPLACSLQCFGQ